MRGGEGGRVRGGEMVKRREWERVHVQWKDRNRRGGRGGVGEECEYVGGKSYKNE